MGDICFLLCVGIIIVVLWKFVCLLMCIVKHIYSDVFSLGNGLSNQLAMIDCESFKRAGVFICERESHENTCVL